MKMLLSATAVILLLCVSCSSVQTPTPTDIPVSVVQPASETQPAFVTGQIIDLTAEPYSDDFAAVADRINSRRDKPKFGYLYIVDEFGMPVQNLQCFSKEYWAKYLSHQDPNSLDMVSLPRPIGNSLLSGILPIRHSRQIENELESLEVVLVNLDTDGEPICLELTLNLAELSEHEAITVVWEGAAPSMSSRNSEWLIDVFVKQENGEPAVGYEVILSEYQDNWSAHSYFRFQSRYTDVSGKATFILNKMAPQTFLDNTESAYMIEVLDSWLDGKIYAYKRSAFDNGVKLNRLEVEFPRPADEVFIMTMDNPDTASVGLPTEEVDSINWGNVGDTLKEFTDHSGSINHYKDYTMTIRYASDKKQSPSLELLWGAPLGSQFLTSLHRLETVEEHLAFPVNEQSVLLSVIDDGIEYQYTAYADGKTYTLQNGKVYYLGQSGSHFSSLQGTFVSAALKHITPEQGGTSQLPPFDPFNEVNPFDNNNGVTSVQTNYSPQLYTVAIELPDYAIRSTPIVIKEDGAKKKILDLINQCSHQKKLEPLSGGGQIIRIFNDTQCFNYMTHGDVLLDYNNHIALAMPKRQTTAIYSMMAYELMCLLNEA